MRQNFAALIDSSYYLRFLTVRISSWRETVRLRRAGSWPITSAVLGSCSGSRTVARTISFSASLAEKIQIRLGAICTHGCCPESGVVRLLGTGGQWQTRHENCCAQNDSNGSLHDNLLNVWKSRCTTGCSMMRFDARCCRIRTVRGVQGNIRRGILKGHIVERRF